MFCLHHCKATIGFKDQPSDARVDLGKDHTFSCIVNGMDNQQNLAWLKDGVLIRTQEDDNRITIGYSNIIKIGKLTTLTLNNLLKSDRGRYQCVVISTETNSVEERSLEAILTVLSQPSSIYPLCSGHEDNIAIGSVITISCISERVEPPVNLTISRNMNIVKNGVSFVENEKLQMLLKTRKEDNRAIFTCHQTSPLAPESESTCSIGPLNVQYKPEIQLQYTNPVISERETILFCQTSSNPPVGTYNWKIEPNFAKSDYSIDETGQVLKLIKPSIVHNGTNITCTAVNKIGKSSSTVTILVESPNILKSNEQNGKLRNQNSGNNMTGKKLSLDVIIVIASGVVIIIVLVVLVPVYHYCLCGNDNTIIVDSLGKEVTQPEVYYETREGVILRYTVQDRSLPRVPTTEVYGHWRHSTASQVPNDLESHSYTYIDTEND
ncbi:cell adhesion molecule 1-like [Antedon mediterranea]|uniref:cell adhesion molecule 1-like n=1 Tax=Antedon mediterranea TaxID=105859 RepID=UPI003AF8D6D4